ncbi:MAG: S1C family serine protease, partial [Acidimicrobiia bacterium]
MAQEDAADDPGAEGRGFPPRSSERSWIHPSELGGGGRVPPPSVVGLSPPRARPFTIAVLSGVVGAVLTLSTLFALGALRPVYRERVVERVARDLAGQEIQSRTAVLAAEVAPALVGVRAISAQGETLGTAVSVSSDGTLLTSSAVVAAAREIVVTTVDGRFHPARVLGSDPDSDLAVLEVRGAEIPVATLGSSDRLEVGETAVVVGAPGRPLGSPSVTVGVIAGIREIVHLGDRALYDMLTTDAAVAQRSRGAAMIDHRGAVVGIATSLSGAEREMLSVVAPVETARRVTRQIMAHGRVTRCWLGIGGSDLDRSTAVEYASTAGVLVRRISPGSPAERAGLK